MFVYSLCICCFFFKQKTAYELRISDWSSDVCSSDLNDCSELEANGSCRFLREDCLTDDTPCSTSERVYECPLPAGDRGGTQYVCDGDVYCIDGSCETI